MPPVRIAVLLAAYNGEPWLAAQFESLFGQSRQDFTVYVSDDQSTDGTAALVRRWADLYPDRIVLTLQPRNLGYKENFRWLLTSVQADYYFFCDQDDVWLSEKVALTLGALAGVGAGTPALAFTDLTVVDAGLKVLHPSLWALQKSDLAAATDLRTLLVTNVVTGCTAALNRPARNLVAGLDFEPAHDHAVALHVLRAGGVLVPVPRPLVWYRQHGTNSIGARPFLSRIGPKVWALFAGWGRGMARRGGDWGLFPSVWAFYRFKAGLWIKRLLKF